VTTTTPPPVFFPIEEVPLALLDVSLSLTFCGSADGVEGAVMVEDTFASCEVPLCFWREEEEEREVEMVFFAGGIGGDEVVALTSGGVEVPGAAGNGLVVVVVEVVAATGTRLSLFGCVDCCC
jgi:hypothetical protein